jgi:hypothetical protein
MILAANSVIAEVCANSEEDFGGNNITCCVDDDGTVFDDDLCQLVRVCDGNYINALVAKGYHDAQIGDYDFVTVDFDCYNIEDNCATEFPACQSDLPVCDNANGEDLNTDSCLCGSAQLIVAEGDSGKYCCASESEVSDTAIENCQGSSVNEYTVSGSLTGTNDFPSCINTNDFNFVVDSQSNNVDYNINSDYEYSVNFSSAQDSVDIGVSHPTCTVSNINYTCSGSKTVNLDAAEITNEDIAITCSEIDENDESDDPESSDVCTPNSCDYSNNAICNVDGDGYINFDLSNVSEKQQYCHPDNCSSDPDCAGSICEESIICDGNANGCTNPTEDPDAGSGLCAITLPGVYGEYNHSWCDSDNEGWLSGNENEVVYCQNCADVDPDFCNAECRNNVLDYGETCEVSEGSMVDGSQCGISQCINCHCVPEAAVCGDGSITGPAENCEVDDDCSDFGASWYCNNEGENADCRCKSPNADYNSDVNFTVSDIPCNDSFKFDIELGSEILTDAVYLKIFVCTTENCNDMISIKEETDLSADLSYSNIYNSIDPNKDYNFSLILFDSSDNEIYREFENENSGDSVCLNWGHGTNCLVAQCIDGDLYQCDQSNNKLANCSNEEFCSDGECVNFYDPDVCEECSGVTGMFVYGLDSNLDPNNNVCANRFKTQADPIKCYLDSVFTSVDNVKACSVTNSCYDYSSESACLQDPCKVLNGDNNCEWVPYNEQTAKGVCRPKNVSFQECDNAYNFKRNDLFLFGSNNLKTSGTVCSLYGDCYFNADEQECKNVDELTCSDFNSEQDCIGNKVFNLSNTTFNISEFSDNLISNKSKCRWINHNCFKDSNFDSTYDFNGVQYFRDKYLLKTGIEVTDDFSGEFVNSSNYVNNRDFTNPQTNIITNTAEFGVNPEIEFIATDNLYNSDNLATFYCLNNLSSNNNNNRNLVITNASPSKLQNSKCDPNNVSSRENWNYVIGENILDLSVEDEGSYDVYFFTVDPSLNLEKVKKMNIYSNHSVPQIDFDYNYTSIFQDNELDTYFSNLNMNVTVTPNSFCTFFLENQFGNKISYNGNDTFDVSGGFFKVVYTDLQDGNYYFNINCTDPVLDNTNSSIFDIEIQGDIRISNVSPRFDVFKQDEVTFEAETHNNGSCIYVAENYAGVGGLDSNNFDFLFNNPNSVDNLTMGLFNTEDGLTHSVTVSNFSAQKSKVYEYNIICKILNESNQSEIVVGNAADKIIFSQDYTAPHLILSIKDGQEDYGQLIGGHWYNAPTVNISCVDADSYYVYNAAGQAISQESFYYGSQLLNSGCVQEIEFENVFKNNTNPDILNCPDLQTVDNNYTKTLVDENLDDELNENGTIHLICYNGSDNLGNTFDTVLNENILIDNRPPTPNMTILSGENEINTIYGRTQTIKIKIDELFGNIDEQSLSFDVGDSFNEAEHTFEISLNNNSIRSSFNPLEFDPLIDTKTNVTFEFTVTDSHGLSTTETKTYLVNTQEPPSPTLEPLLSLPDDFSDPNYLLFKDLLDNQYPVTYYKNNSDEAVVDYSDLNNVYYITDETLTITGFSDFTNEDMIIDLLRSPFNDSVDSLEFSLVDTYDQTSFTGINEDDSNMVERSVSTSELFNNKDDFVVYLTTIYSSADNWNNSYVKLPFKTKLTGPNVPLEKSDGKKTIYGNYSRYYKIVDVYEENLDTGDYTVLKLDSALEDDLQKTGDPKIKIYVDSEENNPFPDDYLRLILNNTVYELVCSDFNKNAYHLKLKSAFVNGENSLSPGLINVFIDTSAPSLNHSEPHGTINNNTLNLTLVLKEHSCGSGIVLGDSSVVLTNLDTDEVLTFNLDEYTNVTKSINENWAYYDINILYPDLDDGHYNVSLNFEDYASNELNENWIFYLNTNAPDAPEISVEDSPSEFNPFSDDNVYAVNTQTPSITLSFNPEDNVTEDTLNVSAINENSEIVFNCISNRAAEDRDTFTCQHESELSEGLYSLNISAYKSGEDPVITLGTWNQYALFVDLTAPNFDLSYPEYVQSDAEVGLVVDNISEEELHVMFNISSGDVVDEIVDPVFDSNTNTYSPVLDASLFSEWVSGETYTLSVTAFDHALNSYTKEASITVDDVGPVINITNFIAEPSYPPINFSLPIDEWNVSTTDTNITIEGNTDSDINVVCMKFDDDPDTAWDCQNRCSEGYPEPCLENAEFTFTFDLSLLPDYEEGEVIYNTINFKARDKAQNKNQTSLAVLLDWQPPSLENVTIT